MRSLVWVSGPAGAGKTTLISSYLSVSNLTGLWYPLHAADADPATFFGRLSQIARMCFPRHQISLPLPTPEYFPDLFAFTHHYFRLLGEQLAQPVVLVFDDYQELPSGSPIHAILAEGFSSLPGHIRAIVISRNSPEPPFARLRVNGIMDTLEWPELRFTDRETAGLVRHLTHRAAAAGQIQFLQSQTDGWVAGLIVLVADAATGKGGKPLAAAGYQGVLFGYFASEIFDRLEPADQTVLLRCAILENLTASMAVELSADPRAARILDELYRRHCFIDRNDARVPTYHWHALFREFLLARDAETTSVEQRLRSHALAGRSLEAAGRYEEAIDHYARTQAWPEFIRLVLSFAPEWIAGGRHRVLLQWIEIIPSTFLEQTPWLIYWRATAELPFDLPKSRKLYIDAFERFAQQEAIQGQLVSWTGVIETFVFQWDDFTGVDPWIEWLEGRFDPTSVFPEPDVEARTVLAMFSALVFRRPDHPHIRRWYDRLVALTAASSDSRFRMQSLSTSIYYLLWCGQNAEAGILAERISQSINIPAEASPLAMHRKVVEALYAWHTLDFNRSYQAVDDGIALAEQTGVQLFVHQLLSQGAYAAVSQGDLEKSKAYLEKISALTRPERRLDVSHLHYQRAGEAFRRGQLPAALEHIRTAKQLALQLGTPFPQALCHQGMAFVLQATGDYDGARIENAHALRIGRAMQSDHLEFVSGLIEAQIALLTAANTGDAEMVLKRTLRLGRVRGIVNFTFWHSEIMSRLCTVALEAGIETDFVRHLIVERELWPVPDSLPPESWPWRYRIFALGGLRILRDGKPVQFSRKTPRKILELLKMLAVTSGWSSRQELTESLWPDADGDRAFHALESALYRLRRLLGENAIEVVDSRLRLNSVYCRTDVQDFESMLDHAERLLVSGCADADAVIRLTRRTAGLFRDTLLPGETVPWIVSARDRFHHNWCRHLERLGRYLESRDLWEEAANVYRLALRGEFALDAFYRRLIAVCERLGHAAEAEILRKQLQEKSLFAS